MVKIVLRVPPLAPDVLKNNQYQSCGPWIRNVLHLFNSADHFSGLARELLTDSLNSRPGQDICRCTFDSNRRDDLENVSTPSPHIRGFQLTIASFDLAVS